MNDPAVAGVTGIIAAAVGIWAGRRSMRTRVATLEHTSDRMAAALDERVQASREDQQTQDRILESMQEGVLLFDQAHRTAFANEAVIGHLGSRPEALTHV